MLKIFSNKLKPSLQCPRSARIGFTLMELLLVIAIMGVLTTLALAMLRSANESARVSATQARISRIESILNAELERFEVRRLPISRNVLDQFAGANNALTAPKGVKLISLQKRIVQDIMNCEFPRPLLMSDGSFARKPDLGLFPSQQPADSTRPSFSDWLNSNYPNGGSPDPLRVLLTNYPSAAVQSWADVRFTAPTFDHPGEYLYEILTRIDMDGVPAMETLGATSFADSDNDGYLEVVDAWGEPLLWFIAQTDVTDKTVTNELFTDVTPIDWTQRQANGLPVGYTPLDSTIPRDLQQIRLTVFSKRMNDQGIYNTN